MPMQRVQGQKDPAIVLLRELTGEPGRSRHRLFFAEGLELVKRAFEFGAGVKSLVLTDRFAAAPECTALAETAGLEGLPVHVATEGLLAKILEAKPTPECIAIVERRVCSIGTALAEQLPLVQMVEHGENADNLGMLLRSCDAAGVTGVILTANTTDPFSRRVVRGSRGAVFTLPICIGQDSAGVIQAARERGIRIIASSAQAEKPYTEADYTKPSLIVVGNEHVGISQTVLETADDVVRIPMLGRINSLNIAVAASILVYEAISQRSSLRI